MKLWRKALRRPRIKKTVTSVWRCAGAGRILEKGTLPKKKWKWVGCVRHVLPAYSPCQKSPFNLDTFRQPERHREVAVVVHEGRFNAIDSLFAMTRHRSTSSQYHYLFIFDYLICLDQDRARGWRMKQGRLITWLSLAKHCRFIRTQPLVHSDRSRADYLTGRADSATIQTNRFLTHFYLTIK